jgi:pimeloyl-ACP methyl ester carboxylesterase
MRNTFIAVILTIASFAFTASGFSQTTLSNGQMISGLSGSTSSQRTYRITVPTGQTKLEIKTYGGSGDADLYVKRGALPTTSSYDLSGQSGSNTETVTISSPSSGDWFILVKAYSAYSGMTLVAAYTAPLAVVATVATPVINPGSQSTMSAVTVSMSCATSGATIRYTTNGSNPTSSSTAYGGAFPLSTSATVKARAFKSGMTDSAIATTSYTISIPSGPANNNFGSRVAISSGGGTVSGSNVNATKESGESSHAGNAGGKSVWWTWTPSVSGSATIKTLGSSFDTTLGVYTGGSVSGLAQVSNGGNDDYGGNTSQVTISVSAGVAYQIAVDGYNGASGSITLAVTAPVPVVVATVATPVINPGSQSTMSAVSVSMSCATSGATIRYTTNGSNPTSSSTAYVGAFPLSTSATVKARAFKSGMTDSAIATTSYTISIPTTTTLANNTLITGVSGSTSSERTYRITVPAGQSTLQFRTYGGSGDADIYVRYGAAATTSSYSYSGTVSGNTETVTISSPSSGDWFILVKAYSAYSGMTLVAAYTAPLAVVATVATPVINPGSQSTMSAVTVSMSCATSGATIRYTTNGSNPTSSSTAYVGAFPLSTSATVKARAFKSGMTDSGVATTSYTISIPTTTVLSNNVAVTGLSGSVGSERSYRITVPAGQSTLQFRTYGGSGDADIFVKYGAAATTSSYSYSGTVSGNTETVTISSPSPGDWFILIRAYSAYSGLTLVTSYTAPLAVVATPVINPGSQSSMGPVTVSMSSATSGATIRYTVDGSDPTSSSTVYGGAFPLSTSTTVKARAFKSGMAVSAVAVVSYSINIPSTLVNNTPTPWIYGQGSPVQHTSEQKVFKFNIAGDTSSSSVMSGFYSLEIGLFTVSGTSGSCDIYVKKGGVPTTASYDFRIYGAGSSKKVLLDIDGNRSFSGGAYNYQNQTHGVAGGEWYIMLHGQRTPFGSAATVSLSARADLVALTRPAAGGIASRPTWLMLHGKQPLGTTNAATSTFGPSSVALENESATDQVLLVDWSSGAASMHPDLSPGRFFIPIAKKAKSLLASKGVTASGNINIVGHSWGTLVGHELALLYGTKITRFVALDPAQQAWGDYNDAAVNFSARALSSWSFVAVHGWFGSESKALTANNAIAVKFDPVSSLNVTLESSTATHGAIVTMFETALRENYGNRMPPDRISSYLKLATMNTTPSWRINRLDRGGALTAADQTNRFEGFLSCSLITTNGVFSSLQSFVYVDANGTRQLIIP